MFIKNLIVRPFFYNGETQLDVSEVQQQCNYASTINDKGQQKKYMTDQLWMQNDTWHSSSDCNWTTLERNDAPNSTRL